MAAARGLVLGCTLLASVGMGAVCAAASAPPAKQQALSLGQWYTVTCPEVFLVGSEAEIRVDYRDIAEKTRLCCDLHYQKSDGRGPAAQMNWGGGLAPAWRPASFGVITLIE
jgi:hypothetical protein